MLIKPITQQEMPSQAIQSKYKGLNKIAQLLIAVTVCLTLSGCATVFGDNTRSIKIDSQPAGAGIYLDNQQYGVTPSVISLPTYIYGGKNITLRKEGYTDQSFMINTQFQTVALLDIFCWPTILIDLAAGNFVKINPANLSVYTELQKVEPKNPTPFAL